MKIFYYILLFLFAFSAKEAFSSEVIRINYCDIVWLSVASPIDSNTIRRNSNNLQRVNMPAWGKETDLSPAKQKTKLTACDRVIPINRTDNRKKSEAFIDLKSSIPELILKKINENSLTSSDLVDDGVPVEALNVEFKKNKKGIYYAIDKKISDSVSNKEFSFYSLSGNPPCIRYSVNYNPKNNTDIDFIKSVNLLFSTMETNWG
ncbi:hypothetical protein [Iodobacter ciconiae]|uniref:Uncharacterized protein n=1 Tax=Iodobacter ciconiae TaxID=2496266 RepID=A0A3S8ZU03_9NEIS|nr:hypothetical protein [Iodobacter ciconiae]AZN36911.1 hypothetical protein EJO50_10705 [Iodobacter ciconiae]